MKKIHKFLLYIPIFGLLYVFMLPNGVLFRNSIRFDTVNFINYHLWCVIIAVSIGIITGLLR